MENDNYDKHHLGSFNSIFHEFFEIPPDLASFYKTCKTLYFSFVSFLFSLLCSHIWLVPNKIKNIKIFDKVLCKMLVMEWKVMLLVFTVTWAISRHGTLLTLISGIHMVMGRFDATGITLGKTLCSASVHVR